jgi:GMP synthase (glutamine-hydrolysing)
MGAVSRRRSSRRITRPSGSVPTKTIAESVSEGPPAPADRILILDFGSQYTQLIARRIREGRVYSEIMPHHAPFARIEAFRPKGIILSGGPASVYARNAPSVDRRILDLGIPILGICYGMQLLTNMLGGRVGRAARREYGHAEVVIDEREGLLGRVQGERAIDGQQAFRVWMSHGDRIDALPPGFHAIGRSANSPIAAMADPKRRIWALQFHPEVEHTPQGRAILNQFVHGLAGCGTAWTMGSFRKEAVASIERTLAGQRAICALSGGVDSAVAAALVHEAIGDRLTCVFVDNGLLRKGEAQQVITTFRETMHLKVRRVDASARFLGKLKGVVDPEAKRRIIGREFIRVFEAEAAKMRRPDWLVQGTLYPDVIESVSVRGPSATIKTHHNVGGLPRRMKFRLIEPLRELFKDEVRLLGAELGVPEDILQRHPFPGPGLAVRVLGALTPDRLAILREADAIVIEEIKRSGLYRSIWQAFAVLLPVRTVGVMGDERTYDYVVAIRAVSSLDGMTADWIRLPHEVLGAISARIVNEVKGVNRVVYDVSTKPPSTIEWE